MKKLLAGLGLIAFGALLSMVYGCATAYDAGWRTTAGVMRASDTTGKQLAKLAQAKVTAKRSGLSADEIKTCREWRDHLERWQQGARPAIRSGVAAAASTLRIAESAGKNKTDWLTPLREAGCGLWRTLRVWGHLLPDKGQAALVALSWLDTGLCVVVSRSTRGTAGAVLGIGLEIFGWLTDIIGAPTDKLKAEIAAWLKAPAADETKPALQAIKERCP